MSKNKEKFIAKLKSLTNGKVILISDYKNKNTKCTFYNTEFKEEFSILPDSLIGWCRRNPGKFYTTPNNNVKNQFNEKRNDFDISFKKVKEYDSNYELIDYKNSKNCTLKHLTCGNIFKTDYSLIFHGRSGCPNCKISKKWTNERFKDEVYKRVGSEYEIKSDYISMRDKVLFLHKECNNEFYMSANNFIHTGNRCPHCAHKVKRSKPVIKIENYLIENNIKYESEKVYEDLYTEYNNRKYYLPFDFKIYLNDNDYFLLEYDGFQHFHGWNKNPNSKLKNMERDKRKNDFCKSNGIKLFRINYKDEYKVINILEEVIKKFNDYPTDTIVK